MKLTAPAVASFVAAGVRRDVPDDDPRGLVLRVAERSRSTWAVRYWYRGTDRRMTLGKVKVRDHEDGLTLAAARRRAREILGQVAAGRDPQTEKLRERWVQKHRVTVRELTVRALKHLEKRLRPSTLAYYRMTATNHIYPTLGPRTAAELVRAEVRAWGDHIADTSGPIAGNRAFELLRRVYAFGIERDLLETSPCAGLKRPVPETTRERVLSLDELWALQQALADLPGSNSDIVRLLLLTGARRGMVQHARREEFSALEGSDPLWTVPAERMKGKREHLVPLSRAAVAIVRSRLALGPVLFPAGTWSGARRPSASETRSWQSAYVHTLRRRMNKALAGAGRPAAASWTIHDLRRTVATHLRERLGVGLDVVSLILGHAPREGPAVTYTYVRAPMMRERRAALERWGDEYLPTLTDPSQRVVAIRSAGDGRGTG